MREYAHIRSMPKPRAQRAVILSTAASLFKHTVEQYVKDQTVSTREAGAGTFHAESTCNRTAAHARMDSECARNHHSARARLKWLVREEPRARGWVCARSTEASKWARRTIC